MMLAAVVNINTAHFVICNHVCISMNLQFTMKKRIIILFFFVSCVEQPMNNLKHQPKDKTIHRYTKVIYYSPNELRTFHSKLTFTIESKIFFWSELHHLHKTDFICLIFSFFFSSFQSLFLCTLILFLSLYLSVSVFTDIFFSPTIYCAFSGYICFHFGFQQLRQCFYIFICSFAENENDALISFHFFSNIPFTATIFIQHLYGYFFFPLYSRKKKFPSFCILIFFLVFTCFGRIATS